MEEVHLWRGSPEQRARRAQARRAGQFAYFDRQLDRPAWGGKKVLDFGGNTGNLLSSPDCTIRHEDYYCLDVLRDALEVGRERFPRAHFVHYDRYSSQFNPGGVRHLPVPDCGVRFDFVFAFSVFTHTHPREMVELVGQLRRQLLRGGVLAFTFCDPAYDRSLSDPRLPAGSDVRKNLEQQRRKNTARDIDELVERAGRSRWCVVIDEELYVEPGRELCLQERSGRPGESYCSFFTVDYMRSLFPEATLAPPVSPEWQHCCILRNE
jgi:SAM-dependent methyltransferase